GTSPTVPDRSSSGVNGAGDAALAGEPRRKGNTVSKNIAAISGDRPTACPTFGSSAKAHSAPALRFTAKRPAMTRLRHSRSYRPTNKKPGTCRAAAGKRAEK